MNFTRFIVDDAMTWLYKTEKFFTLYNTPDEQKVTIAPILFERKVLPWFQLLENQEVTKEITKLMYNIIQFISYTIHNDKLKF